MSDETAMVVGESQHFNPDGAPLDFPANREQAHTLSVSAAINDLLYYHPRHGICDRCFAAMSFVSTDCGSTKRSPISKTCCLS